MIVKVLKTYRDKQAKTVIAKGTLLDIDDTRVEELSSASGGPYVKISQAIQSEPAKCAKAETKVETPKKG